MYEEMDMDRKVVATAFYFKNDKIFGKHTNL